MGKTAQELYDGGHRKVVCVSTTNNDWWTVGKVYSFTLTGSLVDDQDDPNDGFFAQFEPYEFMGMTNKVFTKEEIEELATAVAAKVLEKLKEKL